ncbi:phage tail-like protein [Lewinella aquimaris]|uniref:Phage tail-like protein n=1 Tax=Neolewinella aquimaris TaxID=1835722 RepID=A0A840EFJ1_9BACT|nr:phage tail protein [Neolewinella aquimaris]MBB4079696.1 phage tail-like protein [Neolewinella aquimaris]
MEAKLIPEYYPMVGFHFRVSFGLGAADLDANFQSVTGLEASIDVETIKEGGENRYEHGLPGRAKYSALTLKRGMLKNAQSDITKWCVDAFKNNRVVPIDLEVTLLGEDHAPRVVWKVIHAWPKSWKFNELNAEKGEVFLETLELQYNRFEVQDA